MHATHFGGLGRSYTFDMYKLENEGKVVIFPFIRIHVKLYKTYKAYKSARSVSISQKCAEQKNIHATINNINLVLLKVYHGRQNYTMIILIS